MNLKVNVPAWLLAVVAVPCAVAAEQCPIPGPCLSLAVGEISPQPIDHGTELCIERPASGSADYVLMAINQWHGVSLSPFAVTGSHIVATQTPTGEGGEVLADHAPIAADSGVLLGAGNPDGLIEMTPVVDAQHEAEVADAVARTWAGEAAARGASTRALPAGVPTIGQLLDIQVAQGCFGALDMRKGRVRAVGDPTASGPRVYVVEEVTETSPGSGVWDPAIAGGFTSEQFAAIATTFQTEPTVSDPWGTLTSTGFGAHVGAPSMLEDNFGAITDVDGNGGVVVFFTRALNELSPPASSVVVPSMIQSRDVLDPSECPRSNGGEIVYMLLPDPTGEVNSNVRTVSYVRGLAMRELVRQTARLINASRRIHITQSSAEQGWLDEGLGWAAVELAFYRVSVGLSPRMNIVVTNLTTGQYASRRVDAFNTYQNFLFGSFRPYLQRPDLVGMLQPGAHREANNYAAVAKFLRYAVDRRFNEAGASDVSTFRALVDSGRTGLDNLRHVFAAEPYEWLYDFSVGLYADDHLLNIDPRYRNTSWHYRSLYIALNGSYQLLRRQLSNTVPLTLTLSGSGGSTFYTFGVSSDAAAPATIRFDMVGQRPLFPVNTAVMRVR